MQITCKIYLVTHTGEDIALIASVLSHPLLTAPPFDIQIIIRICYVCLMSPDLPALPLVTRTNSM